MNDHEALRAAAAALRERAGNATGGRWGVHGIGMHMDGTSDYYVIETDLTAGTPKIASLMAGARPGYWNSRHIAGLDPTVALLLADLIESHAEIPYGMGCAPGTGRPPIGVGPSPMVIAIARAYLREPE
jgi:hypothetical protein